MFSLRYFRPKHNKIKFIPNVPPQVDLKDLTDDGELKIPGKEQIEKIVRVDAALSHNPITRLRKAEIENKIGSKPAQGVIYQKQDQKLILNWIYKGGIDHLAGYGGQGKIKILYQNKIWNVLKVKNINFEKRDNDSEFKLLEEKKLGLGRLVRLSFNSHDPKFPQKKPELQLHEEIIMPWLGEWNLFQLNNIHNTLPPAFWIECILGMIKETGELHKDKKIHCDIKLCNFIFTHFSTIKLIDFGMVCDQKTDKQYLGTPGYIAPELLTNPLMPVSIATDIYALGMAIAQLLNFVSKYSLKTAEKFTLIDEFSDEFKTNRKIPDPILRAQCLNFLFRMTAKNPQDRPKLSECFEFFKSIYFKLIKNRYANVCIINLDEFFTQPNIQKQFIQGAKQFDMVWFFEQQEHTTKEYVIARRQFAAANIWIGKYVFLQPQGNLIKLGEFIKTNLALFEKGKIFQCNLLTATKPNFLKDFEENGLKIINVDEIAPKPEAIKSPKEAIIRLSI